MKLDIVYLNDKCRLVKATDGSVGFDVRANIEKPIEIKAGKVATIPLGFKIDTKEAEVGMFLFIRSGIACKYGLILINSVGVIDSDYRGECIAKIWNTGTDVDSHIINPYERIAQVVFLKAEGIEFNEVDELGSTDRGEFGFGSTGKG